jgi:hypothetical protein
MWKEILTLIGIPVVRSFAGWAENAFKDGTISAIEWKQLGETVLRVGMIGLGTYFGLNGMGIDVSAFGAGAAAVVMDFIISAIKKKKE